MDDDRQGPKITLRQVCIEREKVTDHWRIGWRIENRGAESLALISARLPHGQFKSEEILFEPPLELAPRASAQFERSVLCHEPSGLVTENAFIIFRVDWSGEPWRVFARIRVEVDSGGMPAATTESVTTQKIGFSGVAC